MKLWSIIEVNIKAIVCHSWPSCLGANCARYMISYAI